MTEREKPITRARLHWEKDLAFTGIAAGGRRIAIDADPAAGTRPVEALLLGVGGCMAIDIVSILAKMRCPPASLDVDVVGEQNPTPPKYYRKMTLVVRLSGADLPRDKVDRAVALSRDTYCSVLHSLRPDTEIDVEVRIEDEGSPSA